MTQEQKQATITLRIKCQIEHATSEFISEAEIVDENIEDRTIQVCIPPKTWELFQRFYQGKTQLTIVVEGEKTINHGEEPT